MPLFDRNERKVACFELTSDRQHGINMAGFLLPLIMHILFGVEDMPVELGGTSVIIPRNFVGAGYICAMFIVSCHAISMFTGRFASLPAVSPPLHEFMWQADVSLHHHDLVHKEELPVDKDPRRVIPAPLLQPPQLLHRGPDLEHFPGRLRVVLLPHCRLPP